jgi:hypothetical protein
MTDAPNSYRITSAATRSTPRAAPGIALAAIALGLGGLAVATATSDRDFANGFDAALGGTPGAGRLATLNALGRPPIVGSEAFWLDTSATPAAVKPASFARGSTRNIAPGDRYEFGGDGDRRLLEVVDVRPLDTGTTRLDTSDAAGKAQLLVSFRDVGSDTGSAIRLLIDADAPLAGLTPLPGRQHRAL